MADILRSAEAVWDGDLKGGKGVFSATSGVFKDTPYSFATRFESAHGTNPEELIAAAHAACLQHGPLRDPRRRRGTSRSASRRRRRAI